MKTPKEISAKLARQWEKASYREALLFDTIDWPIRIPIGVPQPHKVSNEWSAVASFFDIWKAVKIGRVVWSEIPYRATAGAISAPAFWELSNTAEWIQATQDSAVIHEYKDLLRMVSACDSLFHSFFISNRSIRKNKTIDEIIKAAEVAAILEPGCADGAPLRAFTVAGIDSKFFERNYALMIRLLDLRFDGEVSRQGLEVFLNAWQEKDHWILLADLDGGILPFPQMRVRGSDLANARISPRRLLVIENERCLHLLPSNIPQTLAVLGVGNNLNWLSAHWVQQTLAAYWGDIDTWGLQLLSRARDKYDNIIAILMNRQIFDSYAETRAVRETVTAGDTIPTSLLPEEKILYNYLINEEKGRLEQEFLSMQDVSQAIRYWIETNSNLPSSTETD